MYNIVFRIHLVIKDWQNPRVEDFHNPSPKSILLFQNAILKIKIHLVCKIQNPGFKIHFVHSKSFFQNPKSKIIKQYMYLNVLQQWWSHRGNVKISPCVKIHLSQRNVTCVVKKSSPVKKFWKKSFLCMFGHWSTFEWEPKRYLLRLKG